MLIILVGASGTGKTTIENEIVRISDFKKILSWTTRLPRAGEQNDVDYHFTSLQDFEKSLKAGYFAEYEEYSYGRFYGTLKVQYGKEPYQISVLTPHGVRQLKKSMPHLKMFVVYIKAPLRDRVLRYLSRLEEVQYSDINELSSRVERDFGMFTGFEDEADLVIDNPDQGASILTQAFTILAAVGVEV